MAHDSPHDELEKCALSSWTQSVTGMLMMGRLALAPLCRLKRLEIEDGQRRDTEAFFYQSMDHVRPVW